MCVLNWYFNGALVDLRLYPFWHDPRCEDFVIIEMRSSGDHDLHFLIVVLGFAEAVFFFPFHQKNLDIASSLSSRSSHALQQSDWGCRGVVANNEINFTDVESLFTNKPKMLLLFQSFRYLLHGLTDKHMRLHNWFLSFQDPNNLLGTVSEVCENHDSRVARRNVRACTPFVCIDEMFENRALQVL